MLLSRAVNIALLFVWLTPAQERLSFPADDGGVVSANVYGTGDRGIVLAHGGRLDKDNWHQQAQALASAGFRVLAFDFRGHGQSKAAAGRPADEGRRFDVLAAIRYLRNSGARTVSVVGASMGGDYAAEAAEAEPDAIDRLVLLAAGAYTPLVRAKARKLFLMSRDDVIGDNKPRMPPIRNQYEKASGPKEFVVLEGSAHAQALFQTNQADRVMREIVRFLSAP
jgi:pimeloyl-ACP methyl ester carboxylesterase